MQLAEIYYDTDKFDNAEQELKIVHKKNSEIFRAHFLLAAIFQTKKQYDNALQEAKIALELNEKGEQNKVNNNSEIYFLT